MLTTYLEDEGGPGSRCILLGWIDAGWNNPHLRKFWKITVFSSHGAPRLLHPAGFKCFIITEKNWFGARHDGFAYVMLQHGMWLSAQCPKTRLVGTDSWWSTRNYLVYRYHNHIFYKQHSTIDILNRILCSIIAVYHQQLEYCYYIKPSVRDEHHTLRPLGNGKYCRYHAPGLFHLWCLKVRIPPPHVRSP